MRAVCVIGIAIAIALIGCNPAPTVVNLDWTCAWENNSICYGTMDLQIALEGENQGRYGGEGLISGTALIRGLDGSVLLDSAVTGTWENRASGGGGDIVDLDISTSDARLSLVTSLDSATAADLDGQCFLSGGMTLDAVSGSWHTAPAGEDIELPNVVDAWSIGYSDWEILDMALIGDDIYAIRYDGVDYRIIRIDPSLSGSTSITELTSECSVPYSIAYDGTNTWVVGKADANVTTEPSLLYRFAGSNFESNEPGYPKTNAALSVVDSLSFSGGNLYFHNGEILESGMGTIDTLSADRAYLLQDEWNSSTPALSRTAKIDVSSEVMRTTTFAPGGWWGELRSISLPGGALASSWWLPVNGIGPMASDGTTLYVIQKAGNGSAAQNRLYAIGL